MNSLSRILAISMTVFSFVLIAANAQAASEFRTEGGAALAGEAVKGKSSTSFGLSAAGVTITCTSMTATGILAANATAAEVVFTFKGCSANGTCTVPAELVTNKIVVSMVVAVSDSHALFKPASGKVLIEISFGGAECAFFGKQPVTQEQCALGAAPGTYSLEQTLSASASYFTCPTNMKFGIISATLTGKGTASLSGANSGEKWGVK